MKTILRIILILLAASAVAGVFFLALNNSSVASSPSEDGQPPALIGDGQFTTQSITRPEGGNHADGSMRGLGSITGTLAKLAATIILVLLVQKAVSTPRSRKIISTTH